MGYAAKLKKARRAALAASVKKDLGDVEGRCGHFEAARGYRCPEKAVWELTLRETTPGRDIRVDKTVESKLVRACDLHTDLLYKRRLVCLKRLLLRAESS